VSLTGTTDMPLLAERQKWQEKRFESACDRVIATLERAWTEVERTVSERGPDYDAKFGTSAMPRTHADVAAEIVQTVMSILPNLNLGGLVSDAAEVTVTETTLRGVAKTRAQMPSAIARGWARWEMEQAEARHARRVEATLAKAAQDEGRCEVIAHGGARCSRKATVHLKEGSSAGKGRRVCTQHSKADRALRFITREGGTT
jgi:hypothetical protein